MSIYFSSRSGGPCWSRTLGYHTPASLPGHIQRIITAPQKCEPKETGKEIKAKPEGGDGR